MVLSSTREEGLILITSTRGNHLSCPTPGSLATSSSGCIGLFAVCGREESQEREVDRRGFLEGGGGDTHRVYSQVLSLYS